MSTDFDSVLSRIDPHGGPFAPERLTARELRALAGDEASRPRRPRRLHLPRTPRLADVDPGPPRDWLDRQLDDDTRRRLAALVERVGPGGERDRFGLSPEALRRALPLVDAFYRRWFRVRSRGHGGIPSHGPAILVANHAGLLPFDAAMTVLDVLRHSDPPRLPRALLHRFATRVPGVPERFARLGQVIASRERFSALLDAGELVLVHPEGMEGGSKRVPQRYRLQRFRPTFIELALAHGAPIVPMAVAGSDDQAPVLFDLPALARRLGLPALPVTPTFPWLGPLGLLPLPVRYRIVYGEPLHLHERYGPDDAKDPRLVRYLTQKVRSIVQRLLDCER